MLRKEAVESSRGRYKKDVPCGIVPPHKDAHGSVVAASQFLRLDILASNALRLAAHREKYQLRVNYIEQLMPKLERQVKLIIIWINVRIGCSKTSRLPAAIFKTK